LASGTGAAGSWAKQRKHYPAVKHLAIEHLVNGKWAKQRVAIEQKAIARNSDVHWAFGN
jgi:hypothetical protein